VETVADAWILSRLADLAARVDEGLVTYEFGETARALYDFFWSEFCDWYIELAKPRLAAGGDGALTVRRNLVFVLDRALRLLHPMMPFVTEEIWQRLPLAEPDCAPALMVAEWPTPRSLADYRDEDAERSIALVQELVTAVRAVRARYVVSQKALLQVAVKAPDGEGMVLSSMADDICSLAGIGELQIASDVAKPPHAAVAVAAGSEMYLSLEGLVDFAAERMRVAKELAAAQADLERLTRKLSNEGFLAKAAPEVIEKDRAKAVELAGAVSKLTGQLGELAD
jgi:valyl-tRNA synthetase